MLPCQKELLDRIIFNPNPNHKQYLNMILHCERKDVIGNFTINTDLKYNINTLGEMVERVCIEGKCTNCYYK